MKKYIITFADAIQQNFITDNFDSKEEAGGALMKYINDHNMYCDLDDDYLNPFDFSLEEFETSEVNEIIDFETACEYLGVKPNVDFIVTKKLLSHNPLKIEDVTKLVQSLNPTHIEALIALNELFTIAEAWNKEDEFVPDFSDWEQKKWFPLFNYDKDVAGFICASPDYTPSYASASFGSRLCFKTESRAEQFGKQFAHLYNKIFLIDK